MESKDKPNACCTKISQEDQSVGSKGESGEGSCKVVCVITCKCTPEHDAASSSGDTCSKAEECACKNCKPKEDCRAKCVITCKCAPGATCVITCKCTPECSLSECCSNANSEKTSCNVTCVITCKCTPELASASSCCKEGKCCSTGDCCSKPEGCTCKECKCNVEQCRTTCIISCKCIPENAHSDCRVEEKCCSTGDSCSRGGNKCNQNCTAACSATCKCTPGSECCIEQRCSKGGSGEGDCKVTCKCTSKRVVYSSCGTD